MEQIQKLKRNCDFKHLYYRGKYKGGKYLVTYCTKNRLHRNRIGITVGKKVGNAVCRNRARRLVEEAYRQIGEKIPYGYDFVFVARPKILTIKMVSVQKEMEKQIAGLTTKPKQRQENDKRK